MANTVKLDSVCPQVYGISVRRYQQLAKDGLVPGSVDGYIDFIKSTKALIAYYQKLVQGAGSITLTEERARLTKVQADIATLDYEKELGNLLEKDQVVRAWSAMIQASRSRFLSIPVKVAPLLEGLTKREIKKILEDVVCDALNELASMDVEELKVNTSPEEGEASEEAAERTGQQIPKRLQKKRTEKPNHNVQKNNGQKKCALCGRVIDRRATMCKRCASKQREQKKRHNVRQK